MFDLITPDWDIAGIQTVIFDKDGTLMDSHKYWGRIVELRAYEVAQTFGIAPYAVSGICRAMGWDTEARKLLSKGPVALVGRDQVIGALCMFLKERHRVEADVLEVGKIFDHVGALFQNEMLDYVTVLPGVYSFLERLKQVGARMGIVTSDSLTAVPKILSHLGISDYFDIIIGRESCPQAKETGIPCKMAMEHLDADPWRTIVVGDAPVDMQMAGLNGAMGVGVATGQIGEDVLRKYTDCTAPDMELFVVGIHD